MTNAISPLRLASEFSELVVTLDAATGLPVELRGSSDGSDRSVRVSMAVRLVTGGAEEVDPLGGLAYRNCVEVTELRRVGEPVSTLGHDGRSFAVEAVAGEWRVRLTYGFGARSPRLSLTVEVEPPPTGIRVLRNMHVTTTVMADDPVGWRVHAPGNAVRPGLALSDLTVPVMVSPTSGLKGSAGLVGLEHQPSHQTLVWWPFSRTEIGDQHVRPGGAGPELDWQTDLAGEPAPGGTLCSGRLFLDLVPSGWADIESDAQRWLDGAGIRRPQGAPDWVPGARIFEVQIGESVFSGGWSYSPYPRAEDLLADLERIAGLGFTTLQIMPRQPFPSYNVIDYDDVTLSWGDEGVIREIIDRCHARGMRVIFDILLHGVVDQEAVARAADAVRSGPYAERLGESTPPLWQDDGDSYHVAYSRHIIDFEPYWAGNGSPVRHPLADEHPEWFCRDSAGEIVGVYTKAFDNAHPGWQAFFIEAAVGLVRRLDIDGFRFDAPTYNYFLNWSPRTRSRAGVSMLGSVELFADLRRALKQIKPDVMLYTEPSGLLLRESMDVNYNYDEQWLFGAMFAEVPSTPHGVQNARELAEWLRQRDAWLPTGAVTAHHIDSHDTFWWPLPGGKWFREQFGVAATRALTAVFALSGGPFMMFVGGEEGIEDDLVRIARLRDTRLELVVGTTEDGSLDLGSDAVYGAVRSGPTGRAVVLVNLSDRPIATSMAVEAAARPGPSVLSDLWGGEQIEVASEHDVIHAELAFEPFQIRVLDLTAGLV